MEAAIGIILTILCALEIIFIVRVVTANMPAAAYEAPRTE
jgi:hypothetical protein